LAEWVLAGVEFFARDATGDFLDLGRGEASGVVLVDGLAQQASDQGRGGDVLCCGQGAQSVSSSLSMRRCSGVLSAWVVSRASASAVKVHAHETGACPR
jgi:hypothetical protein